MVKAAFKKRALFTRKFVLNLREKTSKVLYWKRNFAWCWYFGTSESRSDIPVKVWKCGVGEGWRGPFGPTVWEMKRNYVNSRRRGISC